MDNHLAAVFEVVAVTAEVKRFQAAATVAVNELARCLGCDLVGIGFKTKGQVVVAALSGRAAVDRRMNLVSALAETMAECLDQGRILRYPAVREENGSILRAHEEFVRCFGFGFVLTLPFLNHQGTAYGALFFERASGQGFAEDEVAFCRAAGRLLGPILAGKRRNDRPFYAKVRAGFRAQFSKLTDAGYPGAKLAAACLLMLAFFFVFATGEYRVPAAGLLEGTVQRAVIAPFDGYLDQVFYRAGDVVKKGEVLAAMDTRDLMLEKAGWVSRKKQRTLEYHKAMADRMVAGGKIIQEQIQQADSQLALLDEQIARARVRAPFDGLVISGDWSQEVGASVNQGRVLFEVAPLDSYRVKLEVDEKDIAQIAAGQQGRLMLHALPGLAFHFMVRKITPVSISREGRNFFLVEAELAEKSERLRPGMKGYGKIITGRRKLIWIWTHGLVDWLRLRLWSVIP